jgi:hypothetical protein
MGRSQAVEKAGYEAERDGQLSAFARLNAVLQQKYQLERAQERYTIV